MWSESRSQCGERNQRGRLHPERTQHADTPEFQRAVQVMPRRQDYDHGGDGGRGGSTSREYNYYNHSEEYRGYSADNRDYGYGRRFGPSPKTGSWDDENSRWPREDHSGNRPSDYRGPKTKRYATANRDNFRRKNFYSSPHVRERSPHRRETPYYRRESPHSRSGSSISSRSYSPEKNKQPPSHQSQFSKNRERSSVSSLTPSRDASPSGSVLPATSKSFEKSSKTSDNLNKEGVNDWCSEQQQIPELEMPECDTVVYRQDCETFGMVVQMLIDKDPPLENTIQFSLRENLREIGECCIEELRKFITHYDSAPVEHTQNL
ncbi:periphilin-1 isoform X3 [Carcharodon carcharias]|uniref:periphilin-1 isoform X3 n=1 Tax=Carcharodon carcharias TaxID=13397 RepID=UPI001B7EDF85|nr:periphilin-1 isoform X3 [Carcharodon carcharias]